MFRDLKEYQEIAKIYAEKVSKPENLDERVRGGGVQSAPTIKSATSPQGGMGGGVGNPTNRRGIGARNNRPKPEIKKPEIKKFPTTAEIRAGSDRVGGGNAGASTDSGGTQGQGGAPEIKKPIKKMHSIEKKNRARFGDKRIDMLKAKNKDFQAMKKGGMSKDDFIKKYPKSITAQRAAGLRDHKEVDAYDMVLEYLMSTQQVATIEEANYVMIEMDEKTIQSIVKDFSV